MASPDQADILALLAIVERAAEPVDLRREIMRTRNRFSPDALPTLLRHMTEISANWFDAQTMLPPTEPLFRATTAHTFHRYCTTFEWRPPLVAYAQFISEVEAQPASRRDAFLQSTLNRVDPVFPRYQSWLIPDEEVLGMSANDLAQRLKLRDATGPFVVAGLTPTLMRSNDVRVRPPTFADAILGLKVQWVDGEVAGEVVDLDVAHSAVHSLAWVQ